MVKIFDFRKDMRIANIYRIIVFILILIFFIYQLSDAIVSNRLDFEGGSIDSFFIIFISIAILYFKGKLKNVWSFEFYEDKIIFIMKNQKVKMNLSQIKSVSYSWEYKKIPKLYFKLNSNEIIECAHCNESKFTNFVFEYFRTYQIPFKDIKDS